MILFVVAAQQDNPSAFPKPKKNTENDYFFFKVGKELEKVCNAPKDKEGVYIVIELCSGRVTPVIIGYSNSGGP
jgi:hypothetical protein